MLMDQIFGYTNLTLCMPVQEIIILVFNQRRIFPRWSIKSIIDLHAGFEHHSLLGVRLWRWEILFRFVGL